MDDDKKLDQILAAIGELRIAVDGNTEDIKGLKVAIDGNTELVNDLATHMDDRFAAMDEKFEGKIDKLDKKIDKLESTLRSEINTAKYEIMQEVAAHDSMYTEDTVAIADDVVDLKQRVARLEKAAA